MGPLSLIADSFSASPAQLIFHPKRCLRTRLNTNQCQRCVERCPSQALSVENGKICVDLGQCTGCMSCVAACSQDALESDCNLDQLLSSFQPGADAVVSCSRQVQNHPDEITLPCVGIVSKQLLAALLFRHCRSVTFNLVGCEGCCNRSASEAFLIDCKQIIEELSDTDVAKVVLLEKKEHLSNLKLNRRSYLAKIRDIAVDATKQRFLPRQATPLAEPKRSRRIPTKTKLVRNVFTGLDENSQKKILGLFGYTLSINENCDCCPLCKGICPTGAIKIERSSDQGKSFNFAMLDCSGCGLCVEFCKKDALSLTSYSFDNPDLKGAARLTKLTTR